MSCLSEEDPGTVAGRGDSGEDREGAKMKRLMKESKNPVVAHQNVTRLTGLLGLLAYSFFRSSLALSVV